MFSNRFLLVVPFVVALATSSLGSVADAAVSIASKSASPASVAPGASITLSSTLVSNQSVSGANLQYVIYNSSGAQTGKVITSGVNLSSGKSYVYSVKYAVPSDAAPGTYSVAIGAHSSSWSMDCLWSNPLMSFTVVKPAPVVSAAGGSVSPSSALRGATVKISSSIKSNQNVSAANLQYVIYNSAGTEVGKVITSGVNLVANSAYNYVVTFQVPASLAVGAYSVAVGVHSSDWSSSYLWTDAASFSVAAPTPTPTPVPTPVPTPAGTPVVTDTAMSFSPSTLAPGGTVKISSSVKSNQNISGANLQYVIYDDASVMVGKVITTGVNLVANSAYTYTASYQLPSTLPDGNYSIFVGASSSDWSSMYMWTAAGSFSVARAVPPASTPVPTPTPVPPSSVDGIDWSVPTPLITNFTNVTTQSILIGGKSFSVGNPMKSYSISNPDSQTLRFEIRSGEHMCDSWWCDSSAERTEVASGIVHKVGTTINLNYEFMMEPGQVSTARWFVIGQMHDYNVSTSPPFEIDLGSDDHMAVNIGFLTGSGSSVAPNIWSTSINGKAISYGTAYRDPNPIQRGHYYKFKISMKFDPANGFLKVVRDGVTIVNYTGPLGFGFDVYWKMGIYRDATSGDTQAARYRNFVLQ